MTSIVRAGLVLGLFGVTACGGGGGGGGIVQNPGPPPGPAITALNLAPGSASLFVSQTVTLVPTPSLGGTSVSVQYAWSTSAAAVATVAGGVVTAVAPGTAVITAIATASGTGFTTATQPATSTIVVSNPPAVVVALSPTSLALNVGESGTFSVQITGGLTTPTLATCTSSDVSIVTVTLTAAACRVTGVRAGNATITARASTGEGASANVAISALPPALGPITVTPSSANLAIGQSIALVTNANPASPVVGVTLTHESTVPNVATVTPAGIVTGVSPGTTIITVTATGTGTGFITTTRTTTVPVVVSAAPNAFDSLQVTPTSANLAVGQTVTIRATPLPTRGGVTTTVTYQSNNPPVASVANTGVVSANTPGIASISVTVVSSGPGFSTTTRTVNVPVTVVAAPPALTALSVSPTAASIIVGQSTALAPNPTRASGTVSVTYAYQSSATAIATVSSTGVVLGVSPGMATITVTATGSGSGFTTTTLTTTAQVTVAAATACIIADRTLDFTATGTITASDCLRSGVRYQYFRVSTIMPRVIQFAVASTFDPVGVTAVADTATRSVFNIGTTSATGAFFIPAGPTLLGVASLDGALGAFSVNVVTQQEDVDNCRSVTIAGALTSGQRLTANSCLGTSRRFDRFLVFAPGKSCTIDMRVTGQTGSIANPYLEAWNSTGGSLVTSNDDASAGTFDARIVMKECVDLAGGFLDVRAQALTAADFGAYNITVTFGPLIPGAPSVRGASCEVQLAKGADEVRATGLATAGCRP